MTHAFWHDRWATGRIGFHEGAPNELLVGHAAALGLDPGDCVFVPLTGKTRDVGWWLARGHPVVGVELNEGAVRELFDDLRLAPEITAEGPLRRVAAGDLVVFVGDVFDVTAEALGPVAAVYDRAALVALPFEMRARYAAHITSITRAAPHLVLCFEIDEAEPLGPPFSVNVAEIARCYPGHTADALAVREREVGIRGAPTRETAWHLRAR